VFDTAVVYDSSSRHECSVRKISALGATLRGKLGKISGDAVAVELGTGRPAGKIAWTAAEEAGVAFNQPISVLGLINRSLVSQPTERRRMPRLELSHPAHLRYRGKLELVKLRNISAGGLGIQGNDLPARDTLISVFLDGLIVPAGEVVWRKNNLAGIKLFEELSWTSIMPWVRATMRKGT
jgi:hypothetical protein